MKIIKNKQINISNNKNKQINIEPIIYCNVDEFLYTQMFELPSFIFQTQLITSNNGFDNVAKHFI